MKKLIFQSNTYKQYMLITTHRTAEFWLCWWPCWIHTRRWLHRSTALAFASSSSVENAPSSLRSPATLSSHRHHPGPLQEFIIRLMIVALK